MMSTLTPVSTSFSGRVVSRVRALTCTSDTAAPGSWAWTCAAVSEQSAAAPAISIFLMAFPPLLYAGPKLGGRRLVCGDYARLTGFPSRRRSADRAGLLAQSRPRGGLQPVHETDQARRGRLDLEPAEQPGEGFVEGLVQRQAGGRVGGHRAMIGERV